MDEICAQVSETMLREGQGQEVGAFLASQEIWRSYRDAEVAALYPPHIDWSPVARLRRDDLRAELAEERLRMLRRWWG